MHTFATSQKACVQNYFFLLLLNTPEFFLEDLNELGDELFIGKGDALLVGLKGKVGILTNAATNEDVAPRDGELLASFGVQLSCRSTHDADVSNLDLSTAVGTSSPVNTKWSVDGDHLIKLSGNAIGVGLGLNEGKAAELGPSTAHGIANDVSGTYREAGVSVELRLGEESIDLVVVHVGEDNILLNSEADLTIGISLGKVGDGSAFLLAQTSSGNVNTNARLALLLLRMNAEQLTTLKGISRGRLSVTNLHPTIIALNFLDDGCLELIDAILFNEPHKTGLLAVLALGLVTEDAKDSLGESNDGVAVGGDPHLGVNGLGNALDAHVTPKGDVEAHLASLGMRAGLKSDVIDVGVGIVVTRSRNSNVELTRQVGPLGVATSFSDGVQRYEIIESIAELTSVDHFLLIDTCEGTADHITDAVQTRLEGGKVARVQTIEDLGSVLDLDATELNVLSGGNVQNAALFAVLFNRIGKEAQLIGIDDAVGNLEAEHELTRSSLISVKHTNEFEALECNRRRYRTMQW